MTTTTMDEDNSLVNNGPWTRSTKISQALEKYETCPAVANCQNGLGDRQRAYCNRRVEACGKIFVETPAGENRAHEEN